MSKPRSAIRQQESAEMLAALSAPGGKVLAPRELTALLAVLGYPAAASVITDPEIRISLTTTREFGLVLSAAPTGLDAEIGNLAATHACASLTDAGDFLASLRPTAVWRKLMRRTERALQPSPEEALQALLETLLDLASAAQATLKNLDLDLAIVGGTLQVVGACCSVGQPRSQPLPRPIAKIDRLLHPQRIGVIGVSASGMNFGRIILRNLMDSGFPGERLRVIRPGETEIDGVRCCSSLQTLDGGIDLLIVALPAEAVYDLVDEIIASEAIESVLLIPGGLGETAKSREPATAMAARINAAHGKAGGGPIFLGANCLGIVSHPGGYDSWFIPRERLPKPAKKAERNSVLLSQSGAFMISRISHNPWLDPRYLLALGNQTDLTHGDLLTYFAEQPEIETIGVYIEGFRDGDGLDFARAVRRAVVNGKQVVVYKSGQTPSGAAMVMGHTASVAGDRTLFTAVIEQAGAIVAEDFTAFDDLFYMAGALHHKKMGPRLGAVSGAGFEAVGVADAIGGEAFSMVMSEPAASTVERIEAILAAKKLDGLVEFRNPLDINPGADDEAHLAIVEAFATDAGTDAVIVGLDPTAPAMRALAESRMRPGFDINDPKSSVQRMPSLVSTIDKPIVAIVDAGPLYDAMAAGLMDHGVCVFRNCTRATRALVRYTGTRLRTDALRQRLLASPPTTNP